MALSPDAALELVARAARDAEGRIRGEPIEQLLEIVGLERDVRVEADDELWRRRLAERLDRLVERPDDRRAAHRASVIAGDGQDADPRMVVAQGCATATVSSVEPLSTISHAVGGRRLRGQAGRKAREIVGLVSGRRDRRVGPGCHRLVAARVSPGAVTGAIARGMNVASHTSSMRIESSSWESARSDLSAVALDEPADLLGDRGTARSAGAGGGGTRRWSAPPAPRTTA